MLDALASGEKRVRLDVVFTTSFPSWLSIISLGNKREHGYADQHSVKHARASSRYRALFSISFSSFITLFQPPINHRFFLCLTVKWASYSVQTDASSARIFLFLPRENGSSFLVIFSRYYPGNAILVTSLLSMKTATLLFFSPRGSSGQ